VLNNQHLLYVISEGGIASQNFQTGSFLLRVYSHYMYMYKTKDLGRKGKSDNKWSREHAQCTIHLFTVDHLPCMSVFVPCLPAPPVICGTVLVSEKWLDM